MTAPPVRKSHEYRVPRPSPRISIERNAQITLNIVARKRRKLAQNAQQRECYAENYQNFTEAALVYKQLLKNGERVLIGYNLIGGSHPFQVAVALGVKDPVLGYAFKALDRHPDRSLSNDGTSPSYDNPGNVPLGIDD